MRYRIHFEPEDIDANSPEEAVLKARSILPDVRRIFPIDEHGFPLENEN